MTISKKSLAQTIALIRPPERLKISGWAHKYVRIPEEGNAEPGRYSLGRMPHQEEMLDDPLDPDVREIYWMMASQAAGKTMCLNIVTCYTVKVWRKSLLVVRATLETAREWMRDKFMPMVEAMPCMRGVIKDPREKGSRSTAMQRKFPGGGMKAAGAKSPATMRGSSQGKIYQDEIDSYEVTKEGDPCALADRAAITFSDATKLKCSTPTLVGFSRIDTGFQKGDQRYYFLPCWCCGEFQWLKTEQMKFSFTAGEYARFDQAVSQATAAVANGHKWEIGDLPVRDTGRAIYVCEHCHHGWTDQQRLAAYFSGWSENPAIVVNGKELRAHWQATAPFKGIRSRHLNGMYLSIGLKKGMINYLQQFSEDFLEAKKGGRETLMVWTNIFKTIAYEDPHQKTDWRTLKERAEDYGPDLPDQVVWICFGADVQKDRVEILFYGWGEGQESWALDRHIIYGDFDMPSTQSRVSEYLLNKRFKHRFLGELTFSAGAFDSGHQTKVKAVYQFCAKHTFHNIWAVKGFDNALGAVYQPGKEKVHGGKRYNINVDYFKTVIFDRLKNLEPGPRFIHFPKEDITVIDPPSKEGEEPTKRTAKTRFDATFYTQLCSEKRISVKKGKGERAQFEMKWVKLTSSARNEVLDMTVYAFAVYEICRQEDWIDRKWKEVQKKIKEANIPIAVEGRPREIYDTDKEAKLPDVDPAPVQKKAFRKKIRISSPFRKFGM
jgi:phage terminase large subunit GpA-like protein